MNCFVFLDAYEKRLLKEVENCERELFKLNHSFSPHCKKLLKVIQDPWGNITLDNLLKEPNLNIGQEGAVYNLKSDLKL